MKINRRDFLSLTTCCCGGFLLSSCATAPITGRQQLTDRRKSNVYNASASTISINKNSNLNTRQQNDSRQRSARNTNTVDYNIDNLLTKTFLNLPPTPEKSKKAIEKKTPKNRI